MKRNNDSGREDMITRGLGWFSIGLGLSQILAPRKLSQFIGVDEHPALMRLLGGREIASGLGILLPQRRTPGLWARVAGDGMDIALLGLAMRSDRSEKRRLLAATAAVAGVTALDACAAIRASQAEPHSSKSVITVNRPLADVYEFWRDPNNLRQFMASVPSGVEVLTARPNEFMEWRSRDGVLVKSGSASFQPAMGRDGTEVRVVVDGIIPTRFLHEDLRRAKRLIETGEIPTTEGQSAAPRTKALISRLIHQFEGKEVA